MEKCRAPASPTGSTPGIPVGLPRDSPKPGCFSQAELHLRHSQPSPNPWNGSCNGHRVCEVRPFCTLIPESGVGKGKEREDKARKGKRIGSKGTSSTCANPGAFPELPVLPKGSQSHLQPGLGYFCHPNKLCVNCGRTDGAELSPMPGIWALGSGQE